MLGGVKESQNQNHRNLPIDGSTGVVVERIFCFAIGASSFVEMEFSLPLLWGLGIPFVSVFCGVNAMTLGRMWSLLLFHPLEDEIYCVFVMI